MGKIGGGVHMITVVIISYRSPRCSFSMGVECMHTSTYRVMAFARCCAAPMDGVNVAVFYSYACAESCSKPCLLFVFVFAKYRDTMNNRINQMA